MALIAQTYNLLRPQIRPPAPLSSGEVAEAYYHSLPIRRFTANVFSWENCFRCEIDRRNNGAIRDDDVPLKCTCFNCRLISIYYRANSARKLIFVKAPENTGRLKNPYLTFAVDAHVETSWSTASSVLDFLGEPGDYQHRLFVFETAARSRFSFASQRTRLVVVVVRKPLEKRSLVLHPVKRRTLIFTKLSRFRTRLRTKQNLVLLLIDIFQ